MTKLLTAKLINDDCVKWLRDSDSTYDLICADSPYNYGQQYADYTDNIAKDKFLEWMEAWVYACAERLATHGSLFIFAPDEWVTEVDYQARYMLGLYRRGWIVWAYGFGVSSSRNFARAHTHILYYTKSQKHFTFNANLVKVPSNRQLVYKDKRAQNGGKVPDNVWVLTKEEMDRTLVSDGDVWYESRVCGTFKERDSTSPNQIPIALMNRIVAVASNKGDWVLDPFNGTGTTGLAALSQGRNYVGIDISPACIKSTAKRLNGVPGVHMTVKEAVAHAKGQ